MDFEFGSSRRRARPRPWLAARSAEFWQELGVHEKMRPWCFPSVSVKVPIPASRPESALLKKMTDSPEPMGSRVTRLRAAGKGGDSGTGEGQLLGETQRRLISPSGLVRGRVSDGEGGDETGEFIR